MLKKGTLKLLHHSKGTINYYDIPYKKVIKLCLKYNIPFGVKFQDNLLTGQTTVAITAQTNKTMSILCDEFIAKLEKL